MDVSASTGSTDNTRSAVQTEVMKKAIESQEKVIEKTIESATQQSQEITAQKTGVGQNININA